MALETTYTYKHNSNVTTYRVVDADEYIDIIGGGCRLTLSDTFVAYDDAYGNTYSAGVRDEGEDVSLTRYALNRITALVRGGVCHKMSCCYTAGYRGLYDEFRVLCEYCRDEYEDYDEGAVRFYESKMLSAIVYCS